MNNNRKTPEEQREKLRQEELKKNPTGALKDGFDRSETGSLADLVGALGWKTTGMLIIFLAVGYVLYKLLF